MPARLPRARRATSSPAEAQWQREVVRLARQWRWRLYHPLISWGSIPGYPDLTMVRPPRLIYAELKSDTGTTTDAQRAWLDDLSRIPGIEVYLWRPRDVEEVVHILACKVRPAYPRTAWGLSGIVPLSVGAQP